MKIKKQSNSASFTVLAEAPDRTVSTKGEGPSKYDARRVAAVVATAASRDGSTEPGTKCGTNTRQKSRTGRNALGVPGLAVSEQNGEPKTYVLRHELGNTKKVVQLTVGRVDQMSEDEAQAQAKGWVDLLEDGIHPRTVIAGEPLEKAGAARLVRVEGEWNVSLVCQRCDGNAHFPTGIKNLHRPLDLPRVLEILESANPWIHTGAGEWICPICAEKETGSRPAASEFGLADTSITIKVYKGLEDTTCVVSEIPKYCRFRDGHSDRSVAAATGASEAFVRRIREEEFGKLGVPEDIERLREQMNCLELRIAELTREQAEVDRQLEAACTRFLGSSQGANVGPGLTIVR